MMKQLKGSRLLCVLPQHPFDFASGAVRTVRTVLEYLAGHGVAVKCLCLPSMWEGCERPPSLLLHFRGVDYIYPGFEVERKYVSCSNRDFHSLFFKVMDSYRPDLVFGYGGGVEASERWAFAAARARVIFALRNYGYLNVSPDFFAPFSAVLTPSEFLKRYYLRVTDSVALPPLIDALDVVACGGTSTPEYVTVINAGDVSKGRRFTALLAPALAERGIPVLLVEGRGGRFECLGARWMSTVANPAAIYGLTKLLLVPSIWDEPAGRVIVEASLNGIPSIVSNRGGMAEMMPTLCVAMRNTLTMATEQTAISWDDVLPWVSTVEYALRTPRFAEISKENGIAFTPEVLGPRYLEFFERVLNRE